MEKEVYRHGDLLIVPVHKVKDKATKKSETNSILEWEVTNHHHRADSNATVAIAVEEPNQSNDYYRGAILVPTRKTTKITHEEHGTIELTEWQYETYVQREYDPIEERKVLD